MNTHLIVSGIVIILLMVGLSGCNEQEIYEKSNDIEIISYNVTTKKWDDGHKIIGEGFIHSDEAEFYYIYGIVKNIAEETLISVNVTANFYDNANNILSEKTTYLGGIPYNYTKDFGIYYFSDEEFFEDVCGVKFEFEVI